ncbi:unnamed protein product [Dibothriocephalus latus]|uniref:Reverse transcriptase zinc-binding domain-containing protein n=1 Tax=Dibothriocephalus latus TaxID=60516 RepID=A0A3P6QWP6_DIBLA|nr:unnamed protein product [Dibothriocephalus latus]
MDTFKYLGVPFSYQGKVTVSYHSVLYNMLLWVTKTPLKSQQRLPLLKRHCVPKLLHELVLGAVNRNTLKRLDVQIRQAVRLWLRLPSDTPASFLHAAVLDGGLGVPCLTVMVPFAKRRRLDSVLSSQEPAVRVAAIVPSALPGMRMAAQPVRLGQTVLASKTDARNYWRKSLYESANGRPLVHFADSTCANHWHSSPVWVFPWLFLRGIQLRAGVLSTKARSSRRTGREDVLCRGECGQRETLFHIPQCCHLTHQARVWRHNRVMRLLTQCLLKGRQEVFVEPHIPEGATLCKSDLVLCTESGITVIDVALAGKTLLEQIFERTIRRYSTEEIEMNSLRLLGRPANTLIVHIPAVFSCRGGIFSRSERLLQGLGLSVYDLSDCCLAVIRGSLKAYDVHTRGAGRGEAHEKGVVHL